MVGRVYGVLGMDGLPDYLLPLEDGVDGHCNEVEGELLGLSSI